MINHSTVVEEKISKCWDLLHCKIYCMAPSKYNEFFQPWNKQGLLSKCSQNLVRELSAQRLEHAHTCATSPQHRSGKSCATTNSAHIFVPCLRHLLRSEPAVTRAGPRSVYLKSSGKAWQQPWCTTFSLGTLKCLIPTQAQRGVTRWRRIPSV